MGNEEKIQYLIENHQIPRERIFSSRNSSFRDDLMQATSGRGVDIVLNSLSGDLLDASWQCVARFGKMMEIGKRDILEQGSMSMSPFGQNRSYHGIDLDAMKRDRPALTRRFANTLLPGASFWRSVVFIC